MSDGRDDIEIDTDGGDDMREGGRKELLGGIDGERERESPEGKGKKRERENLSLLEKRINKDKDDNCLNLVLFPKLIIN